LAAWFTRGAAAVELEAVAGGTDAGSGVPALLLRKHEDAHTHSLCTLYTTYTHTNLLREARAQLTAPGAVESGGKFSKVIVQVLLCCRVTI